MYQADNKKAAVNHDEVGDCLPCLVGLFSKAGDPGCAVCPGGKTAGDTACVNCDSGRFSSEDTKLKCEKCKVGQYQNKAGQAACIDCIPGMYQTGLDQVNFPIKCELCPVGWSTKNPTAKSLEADVAVEPETHFKDHCVRCLRGKHTNGEMGVAQCNTCPPGSLGERMTALTQGNIGGSFSSEHPAGFVCVKW